MAACESVSIVMVLFGQIVLIAVIMAVSSALVEDGMFRVVAWNSANVSPWVVCIVHPIPILLLSGSLVNEPSVNILILL